MNFGHAKTGFPASYFVEGSNIASVSNCKDTYVPPDRTVKGKVAEQIMDSFATMQGLLDKLTKSQDDDYKRCAITDKECAITDKKSAITDKIKDLKVEKRCIQQNLIADKKSRMKSDHRRCDLEIRLIESEASPYQVKDRIQKVIDWIDTAMKGLDTHIVSNKIRISDLGNEISKLQTDRDRLTETPKSSNNRRKRMADEALRDNEYE
jgi:hypothetical protein